MQEIQEEVQDYIFDYITGNSPIEFSKFQEELKKMGIEKMIAMKQTSLDRYNARLSK